MFRLQIFRRSLSFRTTINPSRKFRLGPSQNEHSLILLTTPSQLQQTIENVYNIIETRNTSNLKIVTACVDTVVGRRNAISELWFDQPITIENYELAPDNSNESIGSVKSSFSAVAPTQLDKNWKDKSVNSNLNIEIACSSGSHLLNMPLANTLFTNGEYYTSFFYDDDHHAPNLENCSRLSIKLPLLKTDRIKLQAFHQLKELDLGANLSDNDGCFQVTDFTSNMIKKINGRPAADYLIANKEIQNSRRDVFMELIDPLDLKDAKPFSRTNYTNQFYKIVVGGLGWGEKQGMIVLDPIVGNIGHRYCRLFQYDPSIKRPRIASEHQSKILTLDCSQPEVGFRNYADSNDAELILENVAGLGNEKGFMLNDIWHTDKGSMLSIVI